MTNSVSTTWCRSTEAQTVAILREHDAGAKFIELGRRHGVHPNTVSTWKAKYGSMEGSEIVRGRAVDDQNARMRRIIANLTLENDAIGASQRATCRITGCARAVAQYRLRRIDEPELIAQLQAIAMSDGDSATAGSV